MKAYETDCIRNIALIGHSGEGKTSLAEAMMFNAKSIDRLCRVDDGNSTMDFDSEEVARKISISLGLGYAEWKDNKLNILDAPGFFDFEGEVISALHVADCCVIVTGAGGYLTVGTEKAIEKADGRMPAIVFINGVDKENSSFINTVGAIRMQYPKAVVIDMPVISDNKLVGYIDLIGGKAVTFDGAPMDIPQDCKAFYDESRQAVLEMAAETDEALLEKFIAENNLSEEEIQKGLMAAISDSAILIMGGSATANMGVDRLMDRVVQFMPSPAGRAAEAVTAGGEEVQVTCGEGSFSAQVFKTVVDQFVGKMLIFKVMSGAISAGDTVYNSRAEKTEKVSGLLVLKGKKQESVDSLKAGDVGAFAKPAYTSTGDTLCDAGSVVSFAPIDFPQPVISFAVFGAKREEEEKVFAGLYKLLEEDSTFKVEKNSETGEMLLSGIGETQLDIICKKVKHKFGVEAVLKEPRITYRETIKKCVEAEGKHKKQSGGAGQFGQCSVRFEPGAEDGVFQFVDAVVGGAIPRQFIPAVEKGLREAAKRGVLAGYPTVNLKCTVFDGKYHPVDSKEIAFITAAKLAYSEGLANANPVFLEPIVRLRIVVPESYMGDVMGDMNKRRGRILGTDLTGGKQVINAEVPQGEVLKYATDLRSMTQGRGNFTSEFARYEEVPSASAAKIIEDAAKRAADEEKK